MSWISLSNITRNYGSFEALKGVDFEVKRSEVMGLVGENGAGKSTMVKIISGFDNGFKGSIQIEGKAVNLGSPEKANHAGIAIAQQELSLIPEMSVAENIFLGGIHGPKVASHSKLCRLAQPYLDEVGLDIDPSVKVNRLSVGERYLVEVARLIAHNPQLLILDEPTAALGESDSRRILTMVVRLREKGKSIIYVSHRLDEIFEITDRITVLRDGQLEAVKPTKDLNVSDLTVLMLGRQISAMYPPRNSKEHTVQYEVKDLWPDRVLKPVSFVIKKGEILGLAGQLGGGSGEVLAALGGAHPVRGGSIWNVEKNKEFLPKSPSKAIADKIAYVSPDRKKDGLFLGRSILENLTSPQLQKFSWWGWMKRKLEIILASNIAQSFTIDVKRLHQEASVLSGGNQQKLALGKWLSIDPKLILVDEPTRGVDVGAKAEIYKKLRSLAEQGATIVVASTDLQEISNLPDRVITFYKGLMIKELKGKDVTSENILKNIVQPENLEEVL